MRLVWLFALISLAFAQDAAARGQEIRLSPVETARLRLITRFVENPLPPLEIPARSERDSRPPLALPNRSDIPPRVRDLEHYLRLLGVNAVDTKIPRYREQVEATEWRAPGIAIVGETVSWADGLAVYLRSIEVSSPEIVLRHGIRVGDLVDVIHAVLGSPDNQGTVRVEPGSHTYCAVRIFCRQQLEDAYQAGFFFDEQTRIVKKVRVTYPYYH